MTERKQHQHTCSGTETRWASGCLEPPKRLVQSKHTGDWEQGSAPSPQQLSQEPMVQRGSQYQLTPTLILPSPLQLLDPIGCGLAFVHDLSLHVYSTMSVVSPAITHVVQTTAPDKDDNPADRVGCLNPHNNFLDCMANTLCLSRAPYTGHQSTEADRCQRM